MIKRLRVRIVENTMTVDEPGLRKAVDQFNTIRKHLADKAKDYGITKVSDVQMTQDEKANTATWKFEVYKDVGHDTGFASFAAQSGQSRTATSQSEGIIVSLTAKYDPEAKNYTTDGFKMHGKGGEKSFAPNNEAEIKAALEAAVA